MAILGRNTFTRIKYILHISCVSRCSRHTVGTRVRATVGVSCGQFVTVRLQFKPSVYIQETVGD